MRKSKDEIWNAVEELLEDCAQSIRGYLEDNNLERFDLKKHSFIDKGHNHIVGVDAHLIYHQNGYTPAPEFSDGTYPLEDCSLEDMMAILEIMEMREAQEEDEMLHPKSHTRMDGLETITPQ